MKKQSNNLYDIAFTERDEEVRRLELIRTEIAAELDGAMAEYAKLAKKKKLGRKKKKKITPLLLEGRKRMD